MRFADVLGQDEIKTQLVNSFHQKRLGHALLFHGSPGSGTLPMALALAQFINCRQNSDKDACGQCPSCKKAGKLIHPDIHFSFPFVINEKKKKRLSNDYLPEWREAVLENPYLNLNEWMAKISDENKQGLIPVAECHNIIRRLMLKTFESPWKVLILWMADNLKQNGNVLLKILEEPPPNTLFILIAENREQLLNTILSRTQTLLFKPLDSSVIEKELTTRYNLEPEEAFRIAYLADGDFNRARQMLQGEQYADFGRLCKQWLLLASDGLSMLQRENLVKMYGLVQEIAGFGREKQKHFIQYCLRFLREVIHFQVNENHRTNLPDEEITLARQLAESISHEQLDAMYRLLDQLHYFIERNANPKIQFTWASFKLSAILKGEEVVIDSLTI